jgi:uncharacterized membrane protein
MNFETSKNLGGIGALLIFIGVIASFLSVPYIGILNLVGIILVLVALYGLSNYYSDRSIFRNALYGFITAIVGGILAVGIGVIAVIANLSNIKTLIQTIYPSWNGDWSSLSGLSGLTPNTSNLNPQDILPLVAGFIVAILVILAIVWIFAIIASFFVRRSLKQVALKSNIGLFGPAGLLLLIGAFLIIAFGLGAILMWIAALLLAIAFFQLKPTPPATAVSPPPPPTPV